MNLLDFIFPKRCVGCGRIGQYICHSCRKLVIPIAPNECICPMCGNPAIGGVTHPRCRTRYGLDGLSSFFYYNQIVRAAIKEIKYRFVSDLAREFISFVPLSAYEMYALKGDASAFLVPIPLHKTRLRYRGFNQSEVLGKLLAARLQIHVCTDILGRTAVTVPQVELPNKQLRLSNMNNVFSVNKLLAGDLKGSTILLFDDVFTTGATMRSAANVLKRSGAKIVWAVSMAR